MPEGKIDTRHLQSTQATAAHLHNRRVERQGTSSAGSAGAPHTRPPNAAASVAHTNTATPELTTHPQPASSARPVSTQPAHEGGPVPEKPQPAMPEHVTPLQGAVKSGMVSEAALADEHETEKDRQDHETPGPSGRTPHPGMATTNTEPASVMGEHAALVRPVTAVPHHAGQPAAKPAPIIESNEPGHVTEEAAPEPTDPATEGHEPKDVLDPVQVKAPEIVTRETHTIEGRDTKTQAVRQPSAPPAKK